MWDPKTGGIHVSRDVIWLQQMFYKAKNTANYVEVNVEPEQNKTQMTVTADEDEESSHESSDKSSESSENESEDAPEDILDDKNEANEPDEPEEPQVTRTRSRRTIH
jgi:cytoskeletal protein RodZ